MGILDSLARNTAAGTTASVVDNGAASTASAPNGRADRKPADFWLNVGVNIPGGGPDGEDIFISLPTGIALDDMKPVAVKGTNQHSINLRQVKNMLLDEVQKLGTELKPGERRGIPQMTVELYRVAKPDQVGTPGNNPLIAGLMGALGGKSDE